MDDYVFDFDRWQSLFPLDRAEKGSGLGGVLDPASVVYRDQLQAIVRQHQDLGPPVPTDVFLFALGEPPRRDVTKVGGLPYRPRTRPWPMAPDGQPMVYLAQYRFSESRDIAPPVPGDILVVFVRDFCMGSVSPQEYLHFEWYPLGLEDLPQIHDVPAIPARRSRPPQESKSICERGCRDADDPAAMILFAKVMLETAQRMPGCTEASFVNCYGLRYRSNDYPFDAPLAPIREFLDDDVFDPESVWPDIYSRALSRIDGMKIGGLPFFPFPEDASFLPPGRFLCSLTSIVPSWDTPYPWVNWPKPAPFHGGFGGQCQLEIRGNFVVNFFINDRQQVYWRGQWY